MLFLHNVYLKFFSAKNTISCTVLACKPHHIVVALPLHFAELPYYETFGNRSLF
jgi:hypothetical protein